MENIYSRFTFGDTVALYQTDAAGGRIGLILVPEGREDDCIAPRKPVSRAEFLGGDPGQVLVTAREIDPLVQLKLAADPYPGGFAQGHSLMGSASARMLRFEKQYNVSTNDTDVVVTRLKHPAGVVAEHRLIWDKLSRSLLSETVIRNEGPHDAQLELLSSFSMGGISPFHADDATGFLKVHRFRSAWSAEGRLETRSLEELHLERSWSGSGSFSERFGQVGSMPVRKWFPFVAIEDTRAGVTWAAQLEWPGSWQLEIYRNYDNVAMAGGLGDREFAHWKKTLRPGETFTSPKACLACVTGNLDTAAARLAGRLRHAADLQPQIEHDLPIIYNEFCTTWGHPDHRNILAAAERLRGTPVRYIVMDAGWYRKPGKVWPNSHGDWEPNSEQFPDGIEATARALREMGFVPGIWFELETCGVLSDAFQQTDHLLKRDGIPITANVRRFWDLNDPWVIDHLENRVFGLIERAGFGYVKIDYNETIGIGCDGAESQGEGLRRQSEAVWRWFDKLRARFPDLVIENCASGGHRLEPSMLRRSAMSSFSDAHEICEIPIIAASLHRLVLPRQSQIWAVLQPTDGNRRLVYSLAAGFLGRLCLSGNIAALPVESWALVNKAMLFYKRVSMIIKNGESQLISHVGTSWRHPEGWQAVLRRFDDQMLVVFHAFAGAPGTIELPLPDAHWSIIEELTSSSPSSVINHGAGILFKNVDMFSARVLLLRRDLQDNVVHRIEN
jgi:alpha-galactosidase